VVRPALSHKIALVEFMNQDIGTLLLFQVVIYPDLIRRYKFIDVVVAALGEFEVEHAAHQPAIDYPNANPVSKLLPEQQMNIFAFRQLLTMLCQTANISGPASLFTLLQLGGS